MALTPAEVFEHGGRMLKHGFDAGVLTLEEYQGMLKVMRHYRENGTHGTIADRREAMKKIFRGMWKAETGNDPDTDPQALHELQTHHIPGVFSTLPDDPEEGEW